MSTQQSHIWRFGWRLAAGAATLAFLVCARAQSGLGDIVYTVGTVAQDAHGQHWAYVLWQATQPSLISNRVFAVYAKQGDPTSAAPYARQSVVTLQTDARVIEPLLRRAENLGDNLFKLQDDLLQIFGTLIPSNSISRADQLSAVIRGSLSDPAHYQNLLMLARNHAGINLALGYADAELIQPGSTTFEVRAFDPAQEKDLAVIGRVTVVAGSPTVLPAPGAPVLVPENSARGDLNLKFRWGTPDALRRLGLMQFGYDLYRVEAGYAALQGWDTTHLPPLTVLTNLVATAPAVARKVNRVPITPSRLLTLTEAASLVPPTGDDKTFFIMDDDGRGRSNYVNYAWTNGARFYYYVAARDVLGRDGSLSRGLRATVCDRMPPLPPNAVHVGNFYWYDNATHTSNQALRVVWKQNINSNDVVTNYWVYRWTSVTQMQALSGDISNNLIAVVPHIPKGVYNNYLDIGPSSPSPATDYGRTFWYTVRAGDAGACAQNLSGPAGPAYGVLRDRIGPPAGTGFIDINCARPEVVLRRISTAVLTNGIDTVNYDFYLTCTRHDGRFEWAEFFCTAYYTDAAGGPGTNITSYIGRLHFLSDPTVSSWWTPARYPAGMKGAASMTIWCRAALYSGKVSQFAVAAIDNPPNDRVYTRVEFDAFVQNVRTVAGGENRECREHDPGGGGGGVFGTNNIGIHVVPSVGSKEYRIYRRVDDGPLSLLCQGAITNIASIIDCFENAPPVNGGTICFYVQLLDENGNPSPMTPLGCVDTTPSSPLPVPILAKITSTGDESSPGMTLSWFCAPYGVERFEVRIAGLPNPPATNNYDLSGLLSYTSAPPASMTFSNFGTNLTLDFYPYITPKAGPGFGNNGALFSVPCSIEVGKTYAVTVRAVGKGGASTNFSNFETFVWAPTNAPSPQVPWPARGLPFTPPNFQAYAFFLSPTNPFSPALRTLTHTGNGVLVCFVPLSTRTVINTEKGPVRVSAGFDPNQWILTNQFGDSLFPCAMYRYQVPNANFPKTSGDVIQVTPLMEKVAYQIAASANSTNTIIHDPFLVGASSSDEYNRYLYLWLKDNQPQISGARYKYVLVRFKPNHEIDQLIPSNEVEVP